MRRVDLTIVLAMIAVAAVGFSSQAPSKPSFQVASVKANANSGFSPTTMRMAGNRFITTGMPLFPLIMQFYNLRDFQISGGPAWINTDQWDIEAVADDGAVLQTVNFENPDKPTPASLMVQSLVENRFQFRFHSETKELPVYELTVARNGPKIKLSKDQGPGTRKGGRGEIELQAYPFATFVYLLARQLDHALIDKTNLKGLYDIKLQWSTELKAESSSDRPSIFTALQDQLGLKLESAKGPVEVLVIDSVSKPSEN
jgi:bla regulator protein BlaR1